MGFIFVKIQLHTEAYAREMGKVDGLSRRPDWKVGVDRDNENQVVIKDNWIHSL